MLTDMLEDADQNNRNNRHISKSRERGGTLLQQMSSVLTRRGQRKLTEVSAHSRFRQGQRKENFETILHVNIQTHTPKAPMLVLLDEFC